MIRNVHVIRPLNLAQYVIIAIGAAVPLSLLMGTSAAAQASARPQPPGLPVYGPGGKADAPTPHPLLPQESDWRFSPTDSDTKKWKNLALTRDGAVTASFGTLSRVEIEMFDNEQFGAIPGSDTFFNFRLNLYAQVQGHDRWRIMTAVKSGAQTDAKRPLPPVEEDFDLHLAFLELSLGDIFGLQREDWLLRAGRFELHYGRGLLISAREGPNVRDEFDGVLSRVKTGKFVTDIFAVHAVEDDFGDFNNGTDDDTGLWGAYTSYTAAPGLAIDAYYFGEDRPDRVFDTGPASEIRHSVGVRLAKTERSGLSFDIEAAYQFGNSKPPLGSTRSIDAGTIAGMVSYAFEDIPLSPVINLLGGWSSGDSDPNDNVNGTFRAPYPPGRFFGDTTPFGPGNLFGSNLSVDFSLRPNLTISPVVQAFWRDTSRDGLNGPPGIPVRGSGGDASYLGTEIGASMSYALSKELSFGAEAGYFFTEEGLEQTGLSRNVTRIATSLSFRY